MGKHKGAGVGVQGAGVDAREAGVGVRGVGVGTRETDVEAEVKEFIYNKVSQSSIFCKDFPVPH